MTYTKTYFKKGNLPKWDKMVLLSQSPRRRELLAQFNPEIMSVSVDERQVEEEILGRLSGMEFSDKLDYYGALTSELASAKSEIEPLPGKLYISADTNVIYGDQIYHKPLSRNEAREMLVSYFGKTHYVITAVSVKATSYQEVFWSWAEVNFVNWRDDLLSDVDEYIDSKKPYDKAGAYGIQELPAHFIKSIEGDPYTIVGLPVGELVERVMGN